MNWGKVFSGLGKAAEVAGPVVGGLVDAKIGDALTKGGQVTEKVTASDPELAYFYMHSLYRLAAGAPAPSGMPLADIYDFMIKKILATGK